MLHYDLIPAPEADSSHLMIVLHGLGDSLEGYRFLPGVMNLPWLNYALVNAPDDYFGGFSWYDFQGDVGSGVVRSRKLLFELIDHFREQGFDSSRIFLFGFSQGCLMTWEIGMRFPHPLAGCIGISGYLFQSDHLLEQASPDSQNRHFLITHGRLDPLIPFDPVKADVNKMSANGIQVEWHEFDKEHTIAGQEEVDVIRQFVIGHRQISSNDQP